MLSVDIERRIGAFHLAASFETGEGITALFGRSGAGKTSVINAIAGILRPDRGRIDMSGETLFDAERGIDVPAPRRRVGYVFQEGRLFPHLSVRQNLSYASLFSRGMPASEFDRLIELLGYPRGTSPLDTSLQPRGYRVLSHIPRVPEQVIGRVVTDFQTLDTVVRASQRDLEAVEGVGAVRAREIREGLRRLQEHNLVDRYLQL